MIRDPSDGTVRETREPGNPVSEDSSKLSAPITGLNPAIVSGLPLESQKPEHIERLEKSRAWLVEYFKRNPEQGT